MAWSLEAGKAAEAIGFFQSVRVKRTPKTHLQLGQPWRSRKNDDAFRVLEPWTLPVDFVAAELGPTLTRQCKLAEHLHTE